MPGVGTTHHIQLGGHYYLVKPGSYQKRVAPQFGARFTSGDPDFNNLSFWQHWAQRCFIGGMDAPEWTDEAMFDDSVGLNTTEHEKVTLSRDLARGAGANWGISSAGAWSTYGYKVIVYNNKLYALTLASAGTESRLWEYDPSTDGWTRITTLDGMNMVARSIGVYDGRMFIGGSHTGTGNGLLIRGTASLGGWSVVGNPSGAPGGVYVRGLRSFQQKFYCAYGSRIYRLKEDLTWDGNTEFYRVNAMSDSNGIIAMEVHLGFLYMLSLNGHVHRTDGNTTFDIWNWDAQTEGVAIRSFDGRLFVLTFEYTNTTDVGQGVLYQMSGSAMTQLKRWGDDTHATRIGNLTVFDRKLWYGASNLLGQGSREGFGVACYDPVEDAHSLVATNSDTVTYAQGSAPYTNYIVDDQIFFGGQLFAFVRGHGAFKTPYKYRDLTRLIRRYDTTGGANGGWLTTSTYDAGTPGLLKLWRKIALDISIPNAACGVKVEYSINNGSSWTTAYSVSGTTLSRTRVDIHLNNVVSVSLKLKITLSTSNATYSPVFYGFVVSYIPVPEPNWQWNFTIALSENQHLLDGTTVALDTEAELDFLGDLYRAKQLTNFVDIDGTSWAASSQPGVLIHDLIFLQPHLGQPLEGDVQVTLIEAAETY